MNKTCESSMKNIYFYSPVIVSNDEDTSNSMFVNTAPTYLNSHIKQNRPDLHAQINWSKIQLLELNVDDIIDHIEKYNIDIFCASIYIWNNHHIFDIINQLRKKTSREFKIVVGGPSVNPHTNNKFFEDNPAIDFAIYAQGENAFVAVLDFLINNKTPNFFDSKNLAWKDREGKLKLGEYQFIKKSEGSPYIESRELLEQIVNDIDYKGYKFNLPYETSKGCPYNCSFCDWSSGLSHKVSHRVRNTWDVELDILGKLGLVNMHMSDANFGQHKQDINIARTMVKLKEELGYKFNIIDTNFSKLKKKESFEILDILLSSKILTNPKFAIQDTQQHVLDNVERPDIPWVEHKKLIEKTKEKYPDMTCHLEIIRGLPGQTRDSWEQTYLDIQGFKVRAYPWVMLPNSPAGYDEDYKKRMLLKTELVKLPGMDTVSEVITETYSYNKTDYFYMSLLSSLMSSYFEQMEDRRLLFSRIRNSIYLDSALEHYQEIFYGGKKIKSLIHWFTDMLFEEYETWPDNILEPRRKSLSKNTI